MAGPQPIIALGTSFKVSDAVVEYLWNEPPQGLGLADLADFEHFASCDADVDNLVAKIPNIPDAVRQAARLKRAWHAVRAAAAETVEIKKRGESAVDLDELLPDRDLTDLSRAFWYRYKQTFPPTIDPSDLVVSRLVREIRKRLLSVRDLAWVKPMSHQLTSARKRTKISDSVPIYVEQGADADMGGQSRDPTQYLEGLRTLAIAYAKAGVTKLPNAPAEEEFGMDQNLFVDVPLDTVMRYVYRAERQANRVPYTLRYDWLRRRDEEERMKWVEVFRNSSLTLGATITLVYTQRENMWEPPEAGSASSSSIPRAITNPQQGQRSDGESGTVGSWASALKSGSKLCMKYQRNLCKNNRCPDKHACAVVVKKNRICLGAHPAINHQNR